MSSLENLWLPDDDDLQLMSPRERLEYAHVLAELKRRQKWQPQPKQAIAEQLSHEVDELLYGGAVGGGKTEWLLEHAIGECEAHPWNRWAIFRRVYPSLRRTVIPRARAKLAGGRAEWNAQDHSFTFPNGSVLELSHLQVADSSHYAWYGAELGGVGFEELTEFELAQYEYLLGRLRAPAPGIRPHAVATTNPGGIGHRWVKRRFVKPRPEDLEPGARPPQPYTPWRQATTEDVPEPLTRAFVPATISDNPALVARDPGYLNRVLAALSDRRLRKALSVGDWEAIDAVEGALWTQLDLDGGRTTPEAIWRAGGWRLKAVAVDPSEGQEDGNAYGVWAGGTAQDGVVYTERSHMWRMSPRDLARATVQLSRETEADAIVVEKNHGGAWLKAQIRTADRYANVVMVWASTGKTTRARPVAALFARDDDDPRMRYRARLIGRHDDLEERLTTWTDTSGEPSPDDLDALVWGHAYCLGWVDGGTTTVDDDRLTGRR